MDHSTCDDTKLVRIFRHGVVAMYIDITLIAFMCYEDVFIFRNAL